MVAMQDGIHTDVGINKALECTVCYLLGCMRGRFIFKLTQLNCFVALKALFYIEKFISCRSKVHAVEMVVDVVISNL